MTSSSELLECDNYRAFLKKALELHYAKKKVNLADFSKRAGFTSRSYLSELLSGKKNLSRDSLLRIKGALKLPKPFLRYFEYLAFQAEPTLRPPRMTDEILSEKLIFSKKQLSSPKINSEEIENISRITGKTRIYQVYAALGTALSGASLEEILQRTKLLKSQVTSSLTTLLEGKVIELREGRYFAKANQLDLFGLNSRQGLADLLDETCKTIRHRRNELIDDHSNLVFYTAFSVNSSQVLRLRERLREAVYDVLDEFQDDHGDTVRQLFFSNFF